MSAQSEIHSVLSEKLKACDVRPTPQRETVLKVILEKRDHPTADEIFARVKGQMPSISLATVYNCLETLVRGGLVRQVNLERAPTRYCPNLHEHAHFHDEDTGKVHDVQLPDDFMDRLRAVLPAGFNASTIELNFRGKAAALSRPEPVDGHATATKATAN